MYPIIVRKPVLNTIHHDSSTQLILVVVVPWW